MGRTIQGFRTGQYTPERVLEEKGLVGRHTVEDLARAASAHDDVNPGYLSTKELQKGAEDLLAAGNIDPNATAKADGYRFASKTLAKVLGEVLKPNSPGSSRFKADEVIEAASSWDDGNGYLNKKELRAGAFELQLRATKPALSADDLSFIRRYTGAEGPGPTPADPATTFVSMDGIDGVQARAAFALHLPGLDADDLESEADDMVDNNEGTRTTDWSYAIEPNLDGTATVDLYCNYDYDGTEFSFYATFEVDGQGGWSVTDAGTS